MSCIKFSLNNYWCVGYNYQFVYKVLSSFCVTNTPVIAKAAGRKRWGSWLRYCVIDRNVAASNPDGVIEIFIDLTMALE